MNFGRGLSTWFKENADGGGRRDLGSDPRGPRQPPPALDHIDAFIFDVDGTLYDQAALRSRMAARIARAHWKRPGEGVRVVRALQAYRRAHEALRGQPYTSDRQVTLAAELCGYPESTVRTFVTRWFEEAPLDSLSHCTYPELQPFLKGLADRSMALGVFSDYPAEGKLKAMGLREFFRDVVCAADVGRQKPEPLGLVEVANRLGVPPQRVVYVGDRNIDLQAAERAGMYGVLVKGNRSYGLLGE